MKAIKEIHTLAKVFNILELLGIHLVLIMALLFQLFLHDLPCPLCLLQRLGFFGIAFGLLLNLRCGLFPSHYSIVLISAIFTSFVAIRQIVLHIIPGTGFYGEPFLGLHLYTWSFIASMAIVIYTSVLLGVDRQYENSLLNKMRTHWITHCMFIITVSILVINIVLLILQCGFADCPENPTKYKILTQ